MRSSSYTVIFDACVLYPAPLRGFLMYLASTGIFRARWTNEIHEEWMRNLLSRRKDLTRKKLEKVRELMNKNVNDCLVEGYQSLIPSIKLPDDQDRHVVAAAIRAGAEAIVTFNLKDFPNENLSSFDLNAIAPDDFIVDLIDLNVEEVIGAAKKHRASLKNPPFTPEAYLDCLLKQKLTKTFSILKKFHNLI